MQESGRDGLAVLLAVDYQLLYRLRLHQAHQTVGPLLFGTGLNAHRRQHKCQRQNEFQSVVNLDFHPSSSNSQSWNKGSILM